MVNVLVYVFTAFICLSFLSDITGSFPKTSVREKEGKGERATSVMYAAWWRWRWRSLCYGGEDERAQCVTADQDNGDADYGSQV